MGNVKLYTKKTRERIRTDLQYGRHRLSDKAQAVVNWMKYQEQAYWLVGDKHPRQEAN
jgi:hypothetical protein